MTKLSSLKAALREILKRYKSKALWFSGGADSLLLLLILLKEKEPFGILRFDDGWTREQRQITDAIILKYKLQVFSYPPTSYLLIGKDSQLSLISRYQIDRSNSIPNIRDLVPGDRCGVELQLETAKIPVAPVEFDAHIFGIRFEDEHYSLGQILPSPQWTLGSKQFFAPLADWKKAEVLEALHSLGSDFQEPPEELNTGNIPCCSLCLQGETEVFCPKLGRTIESVKWNKESNLELFRESVR